MHHLDTGERVEADDGCVGEHPMHTKCPKGFANVPETVYMQQQVRSQQELKHEVLGHLEGNAHPEGPPEHGQAWRHC